MSRKHFLPAPQTQAFSPQIVISHAKPPSCADRDAYGGVPSRGGTMPCRLPGCRSHHWPSRPSPGPSLLAVPLWLAHMASAPPVPEYEASVSSLARVRRCAPSPRGLRSWLVLGGFQAHRLLEVAFKDTDPPALVLEVLGGSDLGIHIFKSSLRDSDISRLGNSCFRLVVSR